MQNLVKVALAIFLFVGVYFLYKGVTTKAWEGDSLAYHIPIAKNIFAGNFTSFSSQLEYYPGAGEAILAMFMFLHLPLNLYNLLAWALLVFMCYRLGRQFGLTKELAIVFGISVGMINSVVRLISTQTIDLWLTVFYLWLILLLETPKNTLKYYLSVGVAAGFVLGIKYSGPLFLLPLVLIYGRRLWRQFVSRTFIVLLPLLILGASWYLRNWFLTGNPFYPSGAEGFKILNWALWKTPLLLPNGAFLLIQSLISEYLIWLVAPIFSLFVANSKLKFLGWINLLICMFLPTWPENIVSDLRYTYVAFIPLILLTFVYSQKKGWSEKISLIAILSMISILPQLDYFPKLFILLPFTFLIVNFFGAPSRLSGDEIPD